MKIELTLFGRHLEFNTKALALHGLSHTGGWWPLINESFTGAWQRNIEIPTSTAMSYYAVYACERLISTDCAKLCWHGSEQDEYGVWTPTTSPAFTPVLRKPNRYQTWGKFVEQYMLSKLNRGNAYVLKERDGRGVVRALYVLDASRVIPLVTQDGAAYYQLKRDDLSGLSQDTVTLPASEIIHDTMIAPFHPLIGLSPLYAASASVRQGLAIQSNSATFFENSQNPNGILTAPVGITDAQAAAIKAKWNAMAPGELAVLAGELKYQALSQTAVESQLIEQEKITAEQVCSAFGVPPYLVDIGPPPPYANFEPLLLKYHSQCIQSLVKHMEDHLDEGLGLLEKIDGRQLGIEADIDDLIWMDTETRTKSAASTVGSATMTPNEARMKYFGLGPIAGGDVAYLQEQNYSLEALAKRDALADPFGRTTPAAAAAPVEQADEEPMAASYASALHAKALEEGLYAA